MKTAKTFRFSEEATSVLDQQENATQYLERLILEEQSHAITFKQMYDLLEQFAKDHLSNLNTSTATTQPADDPLEALAAQAFVPRPPDPIKGYPCCEGISPCKHWVFDGAEGIWRNNLTGATRDA